MVERLRNYANEKRGINHEKTQAPLESHLLDFPVFGRFGSNWKSVFHSVFDRENFRGLKYVYYKSAT